METDGSVDFDPYPRQSVVTVGGFFDNHLVVNANAYRYLAALIAGNQLLEPGMEDIIFGINFYFERLRTLALVFFAGGQGLDNAAPLAVIIDLHCGGPRFEILDFLFLFDHFFGILFVIQVIVRNIVFGTVIIYIVFLVVIDRGAFLADATGEGDCTDSTHATYERSSFDT